MNKFNIGDVVKIIAGDYAGGNGKVLYVKHNTIMCLVDPFGTTQWYKLSEVIK